MQFTDLKKKINFKMKRDLTTACPPFRIEHWTFRMNRIKRTWDRPAHIGCNTYCTCTDTIRIEHITVWATENSSRRWLWELLHFFSPLLIQIWVNHSGIRFDPSAIRDQFLLTLLTSSAGNIKLFLITTTRLLSSTPMTSHIFVYIGPKLANIAKLLLTLNADSPTIYFLL